MLQSFLSFSKPGLRVRFGSISNILKLVLCVPYERFDMIMREEKPMALNGKDDRRTLEGMELFRIGTNWNYSG